MILTVMNAIFAIAYRTARILFDFTSAVHYLKYFIYNLINQIAVQIWRFLAEARKISNKNDRNQVADQWFSLNNGSLRVLIVKVSKNWFCNWEG